VCCSCCYAEANTHWDSDTTEWSKFHGPQRNDRAAGKENTYTVQHNIGTLKRLKKLDLGHGIGNGVKIENLITLSFIAIFSIYVKNTVKSDRLRWLKSTDKNLKLQAQRFWK
jgi:hypothetical protein